MGEEEKDVSELLPAWGQDTAAAVTRMATSAVAQHAEQDTQHQQQQNLRQQHQQAAGAAQVGSSSNGSSSAAAGGADASMLAPGGSIELRNVYFEAVPLNLASALVTDKGLMNQVQVAALMQSRGRGYEHAFGLSLPQDMVAA